MINVDLKPMLKGGISRYSLCVAVAKLSRELNDEAIERKEKEKILVPSERSYIFTPHSSAPDREAAK